MSGERTLVLGMNPSFHDSGVVCIDVRRQEVFGMDLERITRFKHDGVMPLATLPALIGTLELDPTTIDRVVVATALRSQLGVATRPGSAARELSLRAALGVRYAGDVARAKAAHAALPRWRRALALARSSAGRRYLALRLGNRGSDVPFATALATEVGRAFPRARVEVRAYDHHLAHAHSAFVLAGLPDALCVTLDGVGDGHFSKAFVRDGAGLREVSASRAASVADHPSRKALDAVVDPRILATGIFDELTLGHFYSIVTWLLGFEPVSDEGKVEALAAYAPPENEFLTALEGTLTLDRTRAELVVDTSAATALFHDLPRLRGFLDRLGREAMASAIQRFLEERTVALVSRLLERHPRNALLLSGGCAANVVLNMHLFERVCPQVYVVPAMADDGTALGACALALREEGVEPGALDFLPARRMPYFGDRIGRDEVVAALDRAADRVVVEERGQEWPEIVAGWLADGEVGAIVQGRMEWGPRALGNRSILANPCLAETRGRLNAVVKRRPLFQPFCPAILAEERERLFQVSYENPHMTCAFRMRPEFAAKLPGAVHIDGTARAQFVRAADNPALHRLLLAFQRRTGFGVVVNTSFNLHGRTIVKTAADALEDFLDSAMDFLVLEGFLVRRRDRAPGPSADAG